MRRLLKVIALSAVVLWVIPVYAADTPDLFPKEKSFLDNSQKTFNAGVKSGSAFNMVAVGQNGLGARGFNADVFFHQGKRKGTAYAYVGRWGFFDPSHPEFCPADGGGVAVIDVSNPANASVVSLLPKPALTSAEDIVVFTAKFGPLAGRDIAVSGIQACGDRYDASIFRGLALYDVTNPANPVQVGALNIGCCTRGVHELDVQDRVDLGKTFIYGTVPNSEFPDPQTASGVRDLKKHGDARLFDVTDPANAVEVSSWGIKKDLGMDPTVGQGCFARRFGHGMTPSGDGKLVFVSYWDAGFIALDVTDPTHPVFKGKTTYAADEDGDGHSASYDNARKLLFTADEDFCKTKSGVVKGWGYLRVFDYSDLSNPRQIGAFHTADSLGPADPGAGDFVIHNPLFLDHFVYASWYSDGVRVIDVADPTNPREVAFFVPPAGQQPIKPSSRAVLPNTAQDWGVAVDEATGLIYISDMNTGLWILKRTG